MKKALVSPNETRRISETEIGYLIADVVDVEFDVASPMFWIDVPDDTAKQKVYNPSNQELVDIFIPPVPEPDTTE